MIKNILMVVMTIVALMSLVFGYVQKTEADHKTELAIQLKMEAEKQRAEVEKMRMVAEASRMEAEKQRVAAMEAIAACEKSKKK